MIPSKAKKAVDAFLATADDDDWGIGAHSAVGKGGSGASKGKKKGKKKRKKGKGKRK